MVLMLLNRSHLARYVKWLKIRKKYRQEHPEDTYKPPYMQ